MSETGSGSQGPAGASPQKLTAIQIIEQELQTFIQQREQAVANVYKLEGALQSGQQLLVKLRAEAAKAEVGNSNRSSLGVVGERCS